jgi:hypothetical protein
MCPNPANLILKSTPSEHSWKKVSNLDSTLCLLYLPMAGDSFFNCQKHTSKIPFPPSAQPYTLAKSGIHINIFIDAFEELRRLWPPIK